MAASTRSYKPVEQRHRVLEAIEKVWERYPSDSVTQLLGRFTKVEEIRDETLCRAINKRLNG